MRHPNGYGTVVKLSGNRRNPYTVRKTVGFDDRGYPIFNVIGYYPTREAGMIALAQYNNEPWNVEQGKITFEELFELWLEKKAPKLGKRNCNGLKSAYKHCSKLFKTKYKELRSYHMQDIIDNCGKGYSTQGHIKNLFGHLDNFAFELDVINKRYSELTASAPIPETKKQPFSETELMKLWGACDLPWVDSVLIFLYSGWRISELLNMKCSDVDIEAGTMTGGVKSQSGKNRIVPIHSKILNLVIARYNDGGEHLISHNGNKVYDKQYYGFWKEIMTGLQMDHTPHECRHTFRSRLDSAGANKKCIDLLMGHKSKDVGERVYTHKTVQDLRDAIELMTM